MRGYFRPSTPAFHADPYPFYRRLRETDPVHLSALGLWILTRYEDCVTSLRDPRFGRDGFEAILSAQYGEESETGRLPRSMLFRDPPDHTRLRALVNRAFTPRASRACAGRSRGWWTCCSIGWSGTGGWTSSATSPTRSR